MGQKYTRLEFLPDHRNPKRKRFRWVRYDTIENLIRGKRVCVVGPSSDLIGKNRGQEIDRFDVVIRLNRYNKLTDDNKDYGKKTDMVYSGMYTAIGRNPQIKIIKTTFPQKNDFKGSNLIITGGPLVPTSNTLATNFKRTKQCNPHTQMIRIGNNEFLNVYRIMDQPYRPTSGFIAITDLLNKARLMRSLTLYGIDFYLNRYNVHYNSWNRITAFEKKATGVHNPYGELVSFKKQYIALPKNIQKRIHIANNALAYYVHRKSSEPIDRKLLTVNHKTV